MSDPGNQNTSRPGDWQKVRRFTVLDPAGEAPGTVFPTVYVTDELLIDPGATESDVIENLRALAERSGWTFDEDESDTRSRGASRSVRVRLGVARGREQVTGTPDAWALLRQLRRSHGKTQGISLNHVLTTDALGLNPFTANPFTANPFTANPFTANPFTANAGTVGIGSYSMPGTGGRQPVTYLGPEPRRCHPDEVPPIVAIFDTGCGRHPWLNNALIKPRLGSGDPIGIDLMAPTDPELQPSFADQSLGEPMDGFFGAAAGHGTFIAGIIRQECPDAMILPVRVADGDGVILENDLIDALGRLIVFMDDSALEEERGGSKVRVLNLSFSYYHETPGKLDTVSELTRLLNEIRTRDCVVVCSAGNEATSRPTYPATIPADDPARHVTVGALNPSDHSVALFSNIGDWVEVYAPGVSVLSTVPVVFEGGVQAGTRDDEEGHRRETLDLDDFRGGFGVWSGTSFAAPVVAGRIAEQIVAGASPDAAKAAVVDELRAQDLSRTV